MVVALNIIVIVVCLVLIHYVRQLLVCLNSKAVQPPFEIPMLQHPGHPTVEPPLYGVARLDDIELRVAGLERWMVEDKPKITKLERIYQDLSGIEARLRDTLRKRWKAMGLVKPKKEKAPK